MLRSCRVFSGFVWAFSLAPCIQALAVIVPLYWDPGMNCGVWNSYFTIIDAHPSTTFYTIINPNQGPGVNGSQPRAGYQACVQSLKPAANPNAIVLGYVDTRVGTVMADIDTYAGWKTAYRPNGIFLDNVTATADAVDTYSAYISHAKAQGFYICAADAAYFPLVDLINTYDSAYSPFNANSLSNATSTPLSKQSVWLFDASTATPDVSLLNQLGSLGVAAVFVTNATSTGGGLPPKFSAFVNAVASVQETVPSSTGSSTGSQASNTSSSASPSSHSKPTAAIVGGVLGGLVLILGLVLAAVTSTRDDPIPNRGQYGFRNRTMGAELEPWDWWKESLDLRSGYKFPANSLPDTVRFIFITWDKLFISSVRNGRQLSS
ncbi:hypothetical protein MSAN_02405100 [Mycena sanguinolenta]|uniref:Uncharacterized protein n=1 Tax=Mycena sanguinolenta TaxID=230812 RepID=A0A8H6X3R0_9AGAR|nr:hypothetical protein MSAN_02405100 [Mycena sanguinolenta]